MEGVLTSPDGCLLEGLTSNTFVVVGTACIAAKALSAHHRMCRAALPRRFILSRASLQRSDSWHAGNESGSQYVQTAAVADGVLGGIMRLHVIQACHEVGIACIERAPSLKDRDTWKEAFVTNWCDSFWRSSVIKPCVVIGRAYLHLAFNCARQGSRAACVPACACSLWQMVCARSLKRVQAVRSIACSSPSMCSGGQWTVDLADAPGPVTRLLQGHVSRLVEASCVLLDEL